MALTGRDPTDLPFEFQQLQNLFAALIEELDRAREARPKGALEEEDRERLERAKASALKAVALIESLLRSKSQ